MRKSTAVLIAFLCILLILAASIWGIKAIDKNDSVWNVSWSKEYAVSEGVATPSVCQTEFQVDKEGDYAISLSLMPEGYDEKKLPAASDLGFLTSVLLFDQDDNELYSTTTSAGLLDFTMALSPGTYRIEYHPQTNVDAYEEFAKDYLCGAYAVKSWANALREDFGALQKNGSWVMRYEMRIAPSGTSLVIATSAIAGLLISICLTVVFLALITKGKKMQSPKYDERQELERGRGFKYAFFFLLIYFLLLIVAFDVTDTVTPDYCALIGLGIITGIAIYVVYCIWHEAYFALNQKTIPVMILFGFIGLFNLGIAIGSYVNGVMIRNGRFGVNILNLYCALLFLAVFVATLLKKFADSHGKSASGEDDDDEE